MAFIATANGASITGGTVSISTVATVGVNGVAMPANTPAAYINETIVEDVSVIFDLTAIASSTVALILYNLQYSGSLLIKTSTITTTGTLTSTPLIAYSVNGGAVTLDINDSYIGANIGGIGSGISTFNISGGVLQGPMIAASNRNVITRLKGVSSDPNHPIGANGWIIQNAENLELIDCNVKADTSGGGTSSYPAVVIQGLYGANTAKSVKIKGGTYTSIDDIIVTAVLGATGGNTIRLSSLSEIVVGATITGSNISGGGTVTAINVLTKTITYSGTALSSSANGVNYTFTYGGYYLSLLYNYGPCICENLIVQDAFIDYGTILRSAATINQITVNKVTFGPHATYALNLQNANSYNISFSDCYSEGAFTSGAVINTSQAGASVNAGSFVVGQSYIINNLGSLTGGALTTAWNAAGATGTPAVGQVFTATTNGSSINNGVVNGNTKYNINIIACNFGTSPLGSGGTNAIEVVNTVGWYGSGALTAWGTTPTFSHNGF